TYLTASNANPADDFGHALDLSGGTMVVGAPGDDSSVVDSGVAYVLVGAAGTWSGQAVLTTGAPAASEAFGAGVAIAGDTVVATTATGHVHVFTRTGAAW